MEMMAENDRAAEVLMEAAREKEVIVEKAVITVGLPRICSWAREPGRSMASSALKENLLMFRRATCA